MTKANSPAGIFLSRQGVTKEQWLELLEHRRLQITPFLEMITLPRLGDLSFKSKPLLKRPVGTCGRDHLMVRGIFDDLRSEGVDLHVKWGLDRQGRWLRVVIEYIPGRDR